MVTVAGTVAERAGLLRAAIAAHQQFARLATAGMGVDRHLQGLKLTAREAGLPEPALFSDPGILKSARMRLSTSQVFLIFHQMAADNSAYPGAGLQPVFPLFRAIGNRRVRDVLQPPARRPPAALLRPTLRPDRLSRRLRRRPAAEPARYAPPCRRR